MTAEQPVERARRRFPALLALLVLAGVGGYAFLNSAYFRVQQITVTGNQTVTSARLTEMAGVRPGDLRWNHAVDRVTRRLLSEAWVRKAEVSWQQDRLTIAVTEREALGMIPYHKAFLLVDEGGVVLEQVDSLTVASLPVITGVSLDQTLRGERIRHQGLTDALYLLSWMADPLLTTVGEINVDERRQLTFYVDNIPVMWGRLPDGGDRETATQEKLAAFGATLRAAQESQDPVCYIDFRATQPYYGCKQKGSGAN